MITIHCSVFPCFEQCYNLGLQLLEMDRATTAERFLGKALGLLKVGASEAFTDRWTEVMHKVRLVGD